MNKQIGELYKFDNKIITFQVPIFTTPEQEYFRHDFCSGIILPNSIFMFLGIDRSMGWGYKSLHVLLNQDKGFMSFDYIKYMIKVKK